MILFFYPFSQRYCSCPCISFFQERALHVVGDFETSDPYYGGKWQEKLKKILYQKFQFCDRIATLFIEELRPVDVDEEYSGHRFQKLRNVRV